LGARWEEFDFIEKIWTVPEERMKPDTVHRVPLTPEMLAVVEPLKSLQSEYVFEGQQRHRPLSNMAMLMLLRRMGVESVTVHGFRSTFRDWAGEVANGYRFKFTYSDAEYFKNNRKNARIAHAERDVPYPSMEAVFHAFQSMPSDSGP